MTLVMAWVVRAAQECLMVALRACDGIRSTRGIRDGLPQHMIASREFE
mgnify:CR=1 FL=1